MYRLYSLNVLFNKDQLNSNAEVTHKDLNTGVGRRVDHKVVYGPKETMVTELIQEDDNEEGTPVTEMVLIEKAMLVEFKPFHSENLPDKLDFFHGAWRNAAMNRTEHTLGQVCEQAMTFFHNKPEAQSYDHMICVGWYFTLLHFERPKPSNNEDTTKPTDPLLGDDVVAMEKAYREPVELLRAALAERVVTLLEPTILYYVEPVLGESKARSVPADMKTTVTRKMWKALAEGTFPSLQVAGEELQDTWMKELSQSVHGNKTWVVSQLLYM